MTNEESDARCSLERLIHGLAQDIDHLTEDELREEMREDVGDVETALSSIRAAIESGIQDGGRRRLEAARKAYEADMRSRSDTVLDLPLEKKQKLVERFAANDSDLREKLTLAARNEEDFEADLDSLLEDLVELGVLDDKGNPT